jgi:hypothetical protein
MPALADSLITLRLIPPEPAQSLRPSHAGNSLACDLFKGKIQAALADEFAPCTAIG